MGRSTKEWFLYIIETDKNKLYTGITCDVEKRFYQHLFGVGAKYFRSDSPNKLVFIEHFKNRSEASIRETQIKKLTHEKKWLLIHKQET
jgi:putative endonuclease